MSGVVGPRPKYSTFSFDFDGIDEYIRADIVGGAFGSAVERNFSFWFKHNGYVSGAYNPFFCGGGLGTSTSKFRYKNGAGIVATGGIPRIRWVVGGNGFGVAATPGGINCYADSEVVDGSGSAPNIIDGNWHHVFIYNPVTSNSNRADISNAQIWLDGYQLSLTTNAGTDSIRGFSDTISIGGGSLGTAGSDVYTNGLIDEFAYWDGSVLSSAAISEISEKPKKLNSLSNAVLPNSWYRMGDEADFSGGVWALTDQGSNGNDGTAVNMGVDNRTTDTP